MTKIFIQLRLVLTFLVILSTIFIIVDPRALMKPLFSSLCFTAICCRGSIAWFLVVPGVANRFAIKFKFSFYTNDASTTPPSVAYSTPTPTSMHFTIKNRRISWKSIG
jgi:hypothetical protein